MATLSPSQIRLRTGGFRNKSGKIVGGYVLPKNINKDVKAGIVDIVPNGKFGIKVKATRKGKRVLSARVERSGLL